MKSTVPVFIALLLVLHTTTAASSTVLYVTPTPETPCPAKPCHTLSQYAHNVSEYLTTDTTFVFLPGDHSLDTDFNISDISSLVIVGNTSSFPRLTSRVVCSNTDAMVAIANVSHLSIAALEVLSCGQNNVERVSVRVHTVENFRLSSFHLSHSSPLHIYNSAAWLEDNSFANNTGTGCGGSLKTERSNVTLTGTNSFVQNQCRGYGGGMCVKRSTVASNGSVSFVGNNVTQDGGGLLSNLSIVTFTGNIVFEGNYANSSGGGFAVESKSPSYFNGNCSFISNSCYYYEGGAIYSTGLLNFTGESIFLNNSAPFEFGGAIFSYYTMFTGTTSFVGNSAYAGGGLVSVGCKIIGKLTVKSNSGMLCSGLWVVGPLYIAGDVEVSNNINGVGIAIDTDDSDIADSELHGNFLFENNTAYFGAGLYVSGSQLTVSGNFTFRNNTTYDTGGGLWLDGGATLHLLSNTTMLFSENSANKGGAISVDDVNPFLYCIPKYELARHMLDDCFFQVPANYSDIHLQFEYNYAAVAGSDIYGGLIDKCKAKYHENSSKIFDTITENSVLWISSFPYEICYCNSSEFQCISVDLPLTFYPGKTIGFPVASLGQRNGFSPATIQVELDDGLSLGNYSQELQQTTSQHLCSYLQYTLLSSSDAVGEQLSIHLYAAEPCGTTNTLTPLHINININKCPPGFELQPPGSCECDKRLEEYNVTCDINNMSITRTGSVWVGCDDSNSSYSGLIIHSHACPTDYCNESTVSFTFNSTDLQCAHNRSGLLCGACQEGLSLKLGSAQCGRCKDTYLLLFVAFAIAGMALVVLLLVLRLTVTHGTINGLIFYVNVFQSKSYLFLPNNQCIALKIFLSWLNLNFGIDSCLYDGLNTYQNTWLQFLFPAYIWILIGLVICISRWSSWVTRRLGTNPVAVLATLVLLSYNKILQTIITVFSSTELHYTNNSKLVWLYDGNITFLEGEHIPLFVTSLLVLLVLILPYTLLLLFGQCLQANSNLFIFSWVNRPAFKYFLDNYHAPYQDKHRYWTGLMLTARVVLLAAFAANVANDPGLYLLTITTVIVCLQSLVGVFGSQVIYKSQWIAMLDALFMLNLVMLCSATYYCQLSGGKQEVVGYTSLGAAFLTFVGILIYHLHMQVKDAAFGKKLSKKWRNICNAQDYEEEEVDLLLDRD